MAYGKKETSCFLKRGKSFLTSYSDEIKEVKSTEDTILRQLEIYLIISKLFSLKSWPSIMPNSVILDLLII